ncbi:hypothetical protein R3P38DRAFT_1468047 [Favolaschia claudopus]|uniref:Uncharacterized protein n=1 Tax=Favolaschia claudopus TaxID=2862362 RepID=A0AAW0DQG9_9AGAR
MTSTSASSNSTPPSVSALSRADAHHIQNFGQIITDQVIALVSETVFCSIYGIIFALAIYSIFRKGLRSRSSIIMLIVVVYLYAASVTQWALDLADSLKNIHYLLMVPDVPLRERSDFADDKRYSLFGPQEGFFVFNMIIGDSVVIWRTWAVFRGRLLAILLPCVLLLASLVFCIIDLTCGSSQGPLPGGDIICPQASRLGWVFSLATNITCTILIGYQAWKHRRAMRQMNIPGRPHRMSVEKILSILVESGFIYSLLWLTQILAYIDLTTHSAWIYVYDVVEPMGDQISGLYPTLIIVIVNFQRTIWEESVLASSSIPLVPAKESSLRWSVKQIGTTDTTQGVNVQLDTVVDISPSDDGIGKHRRTAVQHF